MPFAAAQKLQRFVNLGEAASGKGICLETVGSSIQGLGNIWFENSGFREGLGLLDGRL